MFVCLLVSMTYLHASESYDWIPCEKTYIDPSEAHLMSPNIFVRLEDNIWILAKAIFTDDGGFYINSFKPVDESVLGIWVCKRCGKHNEGYKDSCRKCGALKSGSK